MSFVQNCDCNTQHTNFVIWLMEVFVSSEVQLLCQQLHALRTSYQPERHVFWWEVPCVQHLRFAVSRASTKVGCMCVSVCVPQATAVVVGHRNTDLRFDSEPVLNQTKFCTVAL